MKQKAKELVDKHYKLIDWELGGDFVMKMKVSKQCALIGVKEMIISHEFWGTEQLEVYVELESLQKEIEKL